MGCSITDQKDVQVPYHALILTNSQSDWTSEPSLWNWLTPSIHDSLLTSLLGSSQKLKSHILSCDLKVGAPLSRNKRGATQILRYITITQTSTIIMPRVTVDGTEVHCNNRYIFIQPTCPMIKKMKFYEQRV